jgi:DinB superfamily
LLTIADFSGQFKLLISSLLYTKLEAEKLIPIRSFISDFKQFTSGKNFWQASLLKQVEDLSFQQALYLPAPDRHCIWELVRHVAYWKHWALTYVKENIAMNAKADNWKPLPEVQTEESWQEEIEKLRKLNEDCIALAEQLGNELFESAHEKHVFFRQIVFHDSYHTGQIGLLRAMQGIKPVE